MSARAWLFGHPVRHSISPAIHSAAFEALGIDAHYEPRDVVPEALPAALAELRDPSALGANLTVPHKEAALSWLDGVDPAAREIGAVNTVHNRDGRLVGSNTDAPGFLAALAEAGFDPRGARVAIVGAGGAARAVAGALAEGGAGELYIVNRSPARATALAQSLVVRFGARPYWGLPLDQPTSLEYLIDCNLIVNATTVGLSGDHSPLPASVFRPAMLVVDIIYNPPRTRLLADAEAVGARTQNGLPMLVHQAALAFATWTGRVAPIDVMRAAAERALARHQ
jgi:shikimate dehydrogenase